MRNIDLIVVHCSATREGIDVPVGIIRMWHKERGFRDIGYHFVIGVDGVIHKGRNIDIPGAHAKGYNANSVGVCYVGGLDSEGNPKDTRTTAQIHALRGIISAIKSLVGEDIKVVGHRDLSVDLNGDGAISKNEWIKACPCFEISEL